MPSGNDERRPGEGGGSSSSLARQAHLPTDRRQDTPVDAHDALALFGARVERNAYGAETTFTVPEQDDYRRGPGRRTTTGPQDAAAPAWWWAQAERIVLDVVNAGGTICSDDLHDAFPEEPSASGAAFGGLFARLAHEGRIVEVGMVKSRRPEARRRRIITWGRL